jgi:hypothetical protein
VQVGAWVELEGNAGRENRQDGSHAPATDVLPGKHPVLAPLNELAFSPIVDRPMDRCFDHMGKLCSLHEVQVRQESLRLTLEQGTKVAAPMYNLLDSAELADVDPATYLEAAVNAALDGEVIPLPLTSLPTNATPHRDVS